MHAIADALAALVPDGTEAREFREIVRNLILRLARGANPHERLGTSWAGDILADMHAHSNAREARLGRAAQESETRRAEQARAKVEEAHARQKRKIERDLVFHARTRGDGSGAPST